MKRFVLMVGVALALCSDAHAKPRRVYSTPTTKTESFTSSVSGSDQERCQAEADYMAANNIRGHVWGCIGRFEGVGFGGSPNCSTCTPGSNMTLTGDAAAQGRNGVWYRVRSWR